MFSNSYIIDDVERNDSEEQLLPVSPPARISNTHQLIRRLVRLFTNKERHIGTIESGVEFDIFELTECPSLGKAFGLLRDPDLQQCVEEKSKLKAIGLVFKINKEITDENLNQICTRKKRKHSESSEIGVTAEFTINSLFKASRGLLIAFQSTSTGKCKIYWKLEEGKEFYYLNIEKKLSTDVAKFVIDFLVQELQSGSTGLLNERNLNISVEGIGDWFQQNLLMKACMQNNSSIVEGLLKFDFNIDDLSSKHKSAADFAWDSGNFANFLPLLKANSRFPKNYCYSYATPEIKMYIIEMRELFRAIDSDSSNSEEIIKSFLRNDGFKGLRHIFNEENVSAPYRALERKKIHLYKMFNDNEIFASPFEKTGKLMQKLSEPEKIDLKKFHESKTEYLPLIEDEHIVLLRSMTKIGNDDKDNMLKRIEVKKAFEYLNQFYFIRIILLLIAKTRKFTIVFDFQRSSINHLDPTLDDLTKGYYCSPGTVYVAAKNFLLESTRKKGYGTLIHELTHFAMNLAYKNRCKPYSKKDLSAQEKFEEICKETKKHRSFEELIDDVYSNYNNSDQFQSELIARVPQLMVMYFNESHLKVIEKTYAPLFKCFEKNVENLKNEKIPEAEREGEEYVEKYLEKTKRQKRKLTILKYFIVICVVMFCAAFSCFGLYFTEEINAQKNVTQIHINELAQNCLKCTYLNLTSEAKSEMHKRKVNLQGRIVDFARIVEPCNTCAFNLNSSEVYDIRFKSSHFAIGYDHSPELNMTYCVDFKFDENLTLLNLNEKIVRDKVILITGEAGSGKSTALHQVVHNVLKKDSLKLIVFVKASDNDFENMKSNDIDSSNFLNFIMEKFVKPKSSFEKEFFIHKLRNNETVFLWDALDEISSDKDRMNIVKLIRIINETTQNLQWITSRHEGHTYFAKKLGTKAFTLQPLDSAGKTKFTECYIENNYFDVKESLKLKVKIVLKKLEEKEPIKNRLLITLIVGIVHELNDSIGMMADLSLSFNIFDLNTSIKMAAFDGKFIRDPIGHWNCHYHYALAVLFRNIYFDKINLNYINVQRNDFENYDIEDFYEISGNITIDSLQRTRKYENFSLACGDLKIYKTLHFNSKGVLVFPHRTFAEYFVAKYLNQRLFNQVSDKESLNVMLRILFFVASHDEYNFIRKLLLESIIDMRKSDSQEAVNDRIADEMIASFPNIFELFGYDTKVIRFLSEIFVNNPKVLELLWKTDKSETAFNAFLRHNFNNNLQDLLPEMINITEEFFSNNSREIMRGRNQDFGILSVLWFNVNSALNYKVLQTTGMEKYQNLVENFSTIETFPAFYDYVSIQLNEQDKNDALKEFYSNYFTIIFFMFIDTKDESGDIWKVIEDHFNNSEINELFARVSPSNRSFLSDFVYLNSDIDYLNFTMTQIVNYLNPEQIKEQILLQDTDIGCTALTYVTWKGMDIKTLDFYWVFIETHLDSQTIKEHLKAETSFFLNALHLSAWQKDEIFFDRTIEIYEKAFTKAELQDIIFNQRSSTNKLFMRSLINIAKKNTCKSAMKHIQELFVGNERKLSKIFSESGVKNSETWCDLNKNV